MPANETLKERERLQALFDSLDHRIDLLEKIVRDHLRNTDAQTKQIDKLSGHIAKLQNEAGFANQPKRRTTESDDPPAEAPKPKRAKPKSFNS